MPKKIFLDIGSHEGETLELINNEEYLFDEIHCFEPMPKPFQVLQQKAHSQTKAKVLCHNFGLADFNGEQEIYGVNIGASMYADKVDVDESLVAKCKFFLASEYFREHLKQEDIIIIKINCEGGEISILNNLLDSGEIFKADHIMIDFDARKIPSLYNAPKEVMKRLKEVKFRNYSLPRGVLRGKTDKARVRNWLGGIACANDIMLKPLNAFEKIYAAFRKHKNLFPLKKIKVA